MHWAVRSTLTKSIIVNTGWKRETFRAEYLSNVNRVRELNKQEIMLGNQRYDGVYFVGRAGDRGGGGGRVGNYLKTASVAFTTFKEHFERENVDCMDPHIQLHPVTIYTSILFRRKNYNYKHESSNLPPPPSYTAKMYASHTVNNLIAKHSGLPWSFGIYMR